LNASAYLPSGSKGLYVPGPGTIASALSNFLSRTLLMNASLPAPNAKVLSPTQWTANVEVVLSGLNREGGLYLSGEGFLSVNE